MLDHAVHADVLDNTEMTPLHFAAVGRNLKVSQINLEPKAEVNGRGGEGRVPLQVAPRDGITDVVRLPLDHNADAHVRDTKNTQFHVAAAKRCPEVIGCYPLKEGGTMGRPLPRRYTRYRRRSTVAFCNYCWSMLRG